jgi:hypothetical protein
MYKYTRRHAQRKKGELTSLFLHPFDSMRAILAIQNVRYACMYAHTHKPLHIHRDMYAAREGLALPSKRLW